MNSKPELPEIPDYQKKYYDFESIEEMAENPEDDALFINGKVVGKNPKFFKRSETYQQNFEKIGNSSENIKVINNFVSEEECKNIIKFITLFKTPKEQTIQWDNEFKPVTVRRDYNDEKSAHKYKEEVQNIMEDFYGVKLIFKSTNISRWDEGNKLDLHVDDLGPTSGNHMASLIYLNDDYEGGEIYFPTHNFSLKPKTGDLIMFPGNMHYAHGVKAITSGSRYTIPMWFEFA